MTAQLIRALQRSIMPGPLQVKVTFPGPVAFAFSPIFNFPWNPGAVMWHEGVGCPFGVSETALRQVIGAGPVMSAVAGC